MHRAPPVLGLLFLLYCTAAHAQCPVGWRIQADGDTDTLELAATPIPEASRPDAPAYDLTIQSRRHTWYHIWSPRRGDRCLDGLPIDAAYVTLPFILNGNGVVPPEGAIALGRRSIAPGTQFAVCFTGPNRSEVDGFLNWFEPLMLSIADTATVLVFGEPLWARMQAGEYAQVYTTLGVKLAEIAQLRRAEILLRVFNEFIQDRPDDALGWAARVIGWVELVTAVLEDPQTRRALVEIVLAFRPGRDADTLVNSLDNQVSAWDRLARWAGRVVNLTATIVYATRIRDAARAYPAGRVLYRVVPLGDQGAPDGAIVEPAEGAVVGDLVEVAGTAVDDCTGVESVRLFWTTDNWQRVINYAGEDRSPPYRITADLSGVPDGTPVVFGWDILDNDGNEARSPQGNRRVIKNAAALRPARQIEIASALVSGQLAFEPGEARQVEVDLSNIGGLALPAGATLELVQGDALGLVAPLAVPALEPGQTRRLTLQVRAPAAPGVHAGAWEIRGQGQTWARVLLSLTVEAPCGAACPANRCVDGRCLPACEPDRYEPDDQIADATALPAGETRMARICPHDPDHFRLDAPAGAEARVTLAFEHARGDLDLEILAPGGDLIARIDGRSDVEVWQGPLPAGAIARVSGVLGASGDYQLTLGSVDACQGDCQGQIAISEPLVLQASQVGRPIEARFGLRNTAGAAVRIDALQVRGVHPDGDAIAMPEQRVGLLPAGATVRYAGAWVPRVLGRYRFYVSYRRDGRWIDIPSRVGAETDRFADVAPVVAGDFIEGAAYKGQGDAEICIFRQGICYPIANEPTYWHLFPGDEPIRDWSPLLQSQYDDLVAAAPCAVGMPYQNLDDPARPGCVLHDPLLEGESHFVLSATGRGRRLPAEALGACFDEARIFTSPGIAATPAWWASPDPLYRFLDAPGEPYYCAPDAVLGWTSCGPCGAAERTVCSALTCLPERLACDAGCPSERACIDGRCQIPLVITPGEVTGPAVDEPLANDGAEIYWRPGAANLPQRTESALFCQIDDGPWERMTGFGAPPRTPLGALPPNARFACRVRTRLDLEPERFEDSSEIEWIVGDDYADYVIEEVRLVGDLSPSACDRLEVEITIRNAGEQVGSYEGRAFAHPVGADERHPDAVPAERGFTAVIAPGETARFTARLPLAVAPAPGPTQAITVLLEDVRRAIAAPVRAQAIIDFEDLSPPTITRLLLPAFDGVVDVQVGGEYPFDVVARDDLNLTTLVLEARYGEEPWQPLGGQLVQDACGDELRLEGAFRIEDRAGQRLTLRATATDAAGRSQFELLELAVIANLEPQVAFSAPAGGERHVRLEGCVPVEVRVIPGAPINRIWLGWGRADGTLVDNVMEVVPVPANGLIQECIRPTEAGDAVHAIIHVQDDQDRTFPSPPIVVERQPADAPWGPWMMDPDQMRRGSAGLSLSGARFEGDTLTVARIDHAGGQRDTIGVTALRYRAGTLEALAPEVVLPLQQGVLNHDLDGFSWSGVGDSFLRSRGETVDRDCDADCEVELRLRELDRDGIHAEQLLRDFPRREPWRRPQVFGDAIQIGGGRLLFVRDDLGDGPATVILHSARAGDWRVLRRHGLHLRGLMVDGGQAIAFRSAREGDRRRIYQVTLSPATGAIVAEAVVMDVPYAVAGWNVARDRFTGRITLIVVHFEVGELVAARRIDGAWRTFDPVALTGRWQDVEIGAVAPSEGLVAGGAMAYYDLQYRGDGRNVHLTLPITDAGPQPLRTAFPGGLGVVDRDGWLYQVVADQWNFTTRVLRRRTHALAGCDDADPCTVDAWDRAALRCARAPVECADDGDSCNGVEVCDPATGACVHRVDGAPSCDDGDPCNGVERCDPFDGACVPGTPIVIDDLVACTLDRCDPATGQVHHAAADDACLPDACHRARCAPADPAAEPGSGCVLDPLPIADDGLACTIDRCDPVLGVEHVLAPGFCLIDGACVAEGVTHPAISCLTCRSAEATAAWSPALDGAACDDGQFCTVDDRCTADGCTGTLRGCGDGPCSRGRCDEEFDECVARDLPEGVSCADADPCDGSERCSQGICLPGVPPDLESPDPCIALRCEPDEGVVAEPIGCDAPGVCESDGGECVDGRCAYPPAADGSPCEGGACQAGRCVAAADRCNDARPIAVGERVDLDFAVATRSDDCDGRADLWLRVAEAGPWRLRATPEAGGDASLALLPDCDAACLAVVDLGGGGAAEVIESAGGAGWIRVGSSGERVAIALERVEACPVGQLDCACFPNLTCFPGVECDAEAGRCVVQADMHVADALIEDSGVVDATPIDATPIDATPIDATPIDATPIDAAPIDAAVVDAAVVDAAAVDAAVADAATADAAVAHADVSVDALITDAELIDIGTPGHDSAPICPEGELGCLCFGNGTCFRDLQCDEARRCVERMMGAQDAGRPVPDASTAGATPPDGCHAARGGTAPLWLLCLSLGCLLRRRR